MAGPSQSSLRDAMIGAFANLGPSCMEISQNKALKAEVERQKKMIELLLKQAKEKDAKIEEKKLQLKKAMKICDDYIGAVGNSTTQIRKIVSENLGPESFAFGVLHQIKSGNSDRFHQFLEMMSKYSWLVEKQRNDLFSLISTH